MTAQGTDIANAKMNYLTILQRRIVHLVLRCDKQTVEYATLKKLCQTKNDREELVDALKSLVKYQVIRPCKTFQNDEAFALIDTDLKTVKSTVI